MNQVRRKAISFSVKSSKIQNTHGKLAVNYLPTGDLIPYARNARTHSDAQVNQICESIRQFGFCNPVLIDDGGGIIAGHGRVLAAKKLGLKKIPTITLSGLSESQRRAYILADNKIAENSGWDEELLKQELEDLASDFGAVPGFGDIDVSDIPDEPIDFSKSISARLAVVVEVDGEAQQKKVYEKLTKEGHKCRLLSL